MEDQTPEVTTTETVHELRKRIIDDLEKLAALQGKSLQLVAALADAVAIATVLGLI